MRALFAHDNRFIPMQDGVYSETQFPATLWQRYLRHFETLTVVGRRATPPTGRSKHDLDRSSTLGVKFVFAPDLSSPAAQLTQRGAARALIRTQLADTDALIARLPSELGLLAIGLARRVGIPYAIEVAGCPWDGLWNYGTWQGKVYAPIMAARTRRAVSRGPYVLYVTREFLQRRYPNRHGVTVACSNVEMHRPTEDVLDARLRRIATQPRPVVLGLIGTMRTRYKGIQTVFEALAKWTKDLPPVEFRLIGGGDPEPWRAEAARWGVTDRVRLDGTLPAGNAVLEWLDGVDLYLQPSLQEGLPRALVEAMSRACPSLGSTCAGIPELLEPECLVRPGDAVHLRQLMVRAVGDMEWQRRHATRNWQKAGNYACDILNARRHAFWAQFAADAMQRSGNRSTYELRRENEYARRLHQ